MMKQHPTPTVHIRKGVFRLAMLHEHLRRNLTVPSHELEERVSGDFGPGGGEEHEGFEAGVGFAEDGVAVAGDDLA